MTPQDAETHEVITFSDVRPLVAADGPCITAMVPLNNPAELEVRVKNAVRGIQKKLVESATGPDEVASLVAPIENLTEGVRTTRVWARTLILFRSPSLFRYYFLHSGYREMQAVANRFQLRPLLQTLAHEMRCYLLALSRHNVRLMLCSEHRAEPVDADAKIPQNLEDWMNNRQPDRRLASLSAAGSSTGGMKGITSGMSTDRERTDEYLTHFFKEIDRGVNATLSSAGTVPLLLAGVEHELAIYRRVNSYRQTLEQTVTGSPDGMTDRSLHERAMEVLASTFTEPLQKAMADVHEYAGTGRSTVQPRAIVRAAFQGRTRELLIAASAEYWGSWDEALQDVDIGNPVEELLNAAALQTLRHGGSAYVVKESDMPVDAQAVAVFRF